MMPVGLDKCLLLRSVPPQPRRLDSDVALLPGIRARRPALCKGPGTQ
jgi:hypothetical protein